MIFRSFTKALKKLQSINKKIGDLHYPSDSKSIRIWKWISDARKQIETCGEHEDIILLHKEELKRIEKHAREAQRIYEKIMNEYQGVRLLIELALIAGYLRLLFPFSKFLADLVKRGKYIAKDTQDDGIMQYNRLKILEDKIIEERDYFTAKYLKKS